MPASGVLRSSSPQTANRSIVPSYLSGSDGGSFMRIAVIVGVALALCTPGFADGHGRGQGAIIIRDGAEVYKRKDATEVEYVMKRGDAVYGFTGGIMLPATWIFDER